MELRQNSPQLAAQGFKPYPGLSWETFADLDTPAFRFTSNWPTGPTRILLRVRAKAANAFGRYFLHWSCPPKPASARCAGTTCSEYRSAGEACQQEFEHKDSARVRFQTAHARIKAASLPGFCHVFFRRLGGLFRLRHGCAISRKKTGPYQARPTRSGTPEHPCCCLSEQTGRTGTNLSGKTSFWWSIADPGVGDAPTAPARAPAPARNCSGMLAPACRRAAGKAPTPTPHKPNSEIQPPKAFIGSRGNVPKRYIVEGATNHAGSLPVATA